MNVNSSLSFSCPQYCTAVFVSSWDSVSFEMRESRAATCHCWWVTGGARLAGGEREFEKKEGNGFRKGEMKARK
jgi:hypothetical protein